MKSLSELRNGEELKEIRLEPVTKEMLVAYAHASGDHNPIHQDEEQAKKLGLPGIIAHGMWTMGNLSKLFTAYYEEGYMKDFSIRFRGMVFLGDTIKLKAKLEEKKNQDMYFNVTAINQHEQEVLRGKVVYTLY